MKRGRQQVLTLNPSFEAQHPATLFESEFGEHLERRLEPEDLAGPVLQSVLN